VVGVPKNRDVFQVIMLVLYIQCVITTISYIVLEIVLGSSIVIHVLRMQRVVGVKISPTWLLGVFLLSLLEFNVLQIIWLVKVQTNALNDKLKLFVLSLPRLRVSKLRLKNHLKKKELEDGKINMLWSGKGDINKEWNHSETIVVLLEELLPNLI